MKLYGRYLSPYVRRVGTSLTLLGLPFELKVLSVLTDQDAIRAVNPLVRVPALELDDGTILIESWAILDYLDELVGPEKALVPPKGKDRRDVLQYAVHATGACDKIVTAFYERTRRPAEFTYEPWAEYCEEQARGGLSVLDGALEGRSYLVGDRLTQADVSAVIAYDFARQVLPDRVAPEGRFPNLAAHSAKLNALDAFRGTHPANQ